MLFSSITFIFVFLPFVVAFYYLVPQRFQNPVMLIASLVFYAWGEPMYIVLLILSAVFNYFCGRDIEEKKGVPQLAKRSLIMAIVVNLLILGFFKYYGWLLGTVNTLFSVEIPYRVLSVPVGLSFYTLQALGYLIDIYRDEIKAERNVFRFMLYMALFPKMNAGPLVRYVHLQPQLERRTVNIYKLGQGAGVFVCGLAKRVILADMAGAIFTQVSSLQMGTISVLTAWIGCLAFAFQIYFAFSGYSDMALGLGRMFGFELGVNFQYPYTAKSVSEFWRRWHISLSEWFKQYVYIPLGGSFCEPVTHIRNIVVVWLLMGVWYGAKWNMVLWGLFFGVVLVMEKYAWGNRLSQFPEFVQHAYTFIVVSIGWVLFFSPDTGYAFDYLGIMFGLGGRELVDQQSLYLIVTHWLLFLLCILGSSIRGRDLFRTLTEDYKSEKVRRVVVSVLYALLLIVSIAFLVTGERIPVL